jgi:hypothetical protein
MSRALAIISFVAPALLNALTALRGKVAPPIRAPFPLGDAQGHVDPAADIAPIEALLAQGCDLEADILPTVAGTVPDLPRPLKNWGAKWLVQEILAARDRRLFPTLVIRRPLADEDYDASGVSPVEAALNILDGGLVALRPAPEMARSDFRREPENLEAPPPARRLSAMDWDEFVAGHPCWPHRMEQDAAQPWSRRARNGATSARARVLSRSTMNGRRMPRDRALSRNEPGRCGVSAIAEAFFQSRVFAHLALAQEL